MKKHITIPRLIGIILLLSAIVIKFVDLKGWIGLGIAAIILLATPKKYAEKTYTELINTIHAWKPWFLMALYEALHWGAIYGALIIYKGRLEKKVLTAQISASFDKASLMDAGTALQSTAVLKGLVTYLIISALLLIAVFFLINLVSRTLIWTTLAKKKRDKKFIKKFAALNGIWWAIWVPIFFIVSIGAKAVPGAQSAYVVIFIIAAYFTFHVHAHFMHKQKLSSIGHGIAQGITKIPKLITPFTFLYIIYIVAYQGFHILQKLITVNYATIVFVVLFVAFLRAYLYKTVQ